LSERGPSVAMVIMMIMRILVEKLLRQDSRGWSLVFETLPTRSVWVCGYILSCPALNDVAPRNPVVTALARYRKAPGSRGRVHMARWWDSVHFTVTEESSISFVPKFSSF
jgi:hypothetical protein